MDLDPVQPQLACARTNPPLPACAAPINIPFPNPIPPEVGFPTELCSHPIQNPFPGAASQGKSYVCVCVGRACAREVFILKARRAAGGTVSRGESDAEHRSAAEGARALGVALPMVTFQLEKSGMSTRASLGCTSPFQQREMGFKQS